MSRRGENIYRRSDGRWEGRYILSRDPHGKAVYRSIYAHSYTEVKEKLRKCMQSSKKVSRTEEAPCFDLLASLWLSSVKLKRKISTYNKYKNLYYSYIQPMIGDKTVDAANMKMIGQIFISNGHLSPKTQNDILSVLKLIVDFAVKNNYETRLNLQNLSIRQEDRDMRVLSPSEQSLLTDHLLKEPDRCKIGVLICLYTGIRIGELCALRFENINIDQGILTVRKTMQRVQVEGKEQKTEIIITEPKSKKSIRDIPIPNDLLIIIKKWYGDLRSEDFILTGKSSKFIEPRTLEYRFKKYVKECGMQNVNFHALRHTFATRCVEEGFDIKTLSEILGHVNVNITLNRYVHSSMELKRANMDKLNIMI